MTAQDRDEHVRHLLGLLERAYEMIDYAADYPRRNAEWRALSNEIAAVLAAHGIDVPEE